MSANRERYLGFSNKPSDLEFFLSFIKNSPSRTNMPFFSFYYYLYIRRYLPEEFTKSFEIDHQLSISPESEQYSYDDFVHMSHKDISALIKQHEPTSEIGADLEKRISTLYIDIKSKQQIPAKTTLKDMLIKSGADESVATPEYIANYRGMMAPVMRIEIEKELGIKLSEYHIRTQLALLNFLSRASRVDVRQVKTLIESGESDHERKSIAECLLILEKGDPYLALEYVNGLLDDKELGMPIIEKFNELVISVNDVENILQVQFHVSPTSKGVAQISKTITERAVALLSRYYSDFWTQGKHAEIAYGSEMLLDIYDEEFGHLTGGYDERDREQGSRLQDFKKSREALQQKILADLETINSGTLLLLSSLKALHDEGHAIDLDEIQNITFGIEQPEGLTLDDKATLRHTYSENYATKPELRDKLLADFNKVLDGEGTDILYVIRHKADDGTNPIRASYRLELADDGHLYFAAFNVDPTYRGSALGEMMLEQSLDKVADQNIIEADCDQSTVVANNYIERGFVGVKHSPDYYGIGVINIFRNDSLRNDYFHAPRMSKDEIINKARTGESIFGQEMIIATQDVSHIDSLPFNLLDGESQEYRYVLTRYFRSKDVDGKESIYSVFEKISEEKLQKFITPNTTQAPQTPVSDETPLPSEEEQIAA